MQTVCDWAPNKNGTASSVGDTHTLWPKGGNAVYYSTGKAQLKVPYKAL